MMNNVHKIVRGWLISILPEVAPENIIRGYQNNAPMPKPPFVVMSEVFAQRHATNEVYYDRENEKQASIIPLQITLQIDCYGADSFDYVRRICTLWFSNAIKLKGVAPLYHSEPRLIPLMDSEANYELRWSVDLKLQINPATETPMEFAEEVDFTTFMLKEETCNTSP